MPHIKEQNIIELEYGKETTTLTMVTPKAILLAGLVINLNLLYSN